MYIYEKDKIFQTIESRKPRGDVDNSFGLKGSFSFLNITDKFLA